MSDALGKSCNCYFASLVEQLDVDDACDTLEELGIDTLGKRKEGKINELVYKKGTATFVNNTSSQHIWKLIGPGSDISLVDMAKIAGAISNNGSCAVPYLVESIYDPNDEVYTYQNQEAKMEALVQPEVAEILKPIWSNAVDKYYRNRLDSRITLAKTGTSENTVNETGEEYNNRLLLGVVDEYQTAFMLVVEHLPAGNNKIMDIANTLVQVLDENLGA
jgi:membrane peptidoglycan carboxypeptidase